MKKTGMVVGVFFYVLVMGSNCHGLSLGIEPGWSVYLGKSPGDVIEGQVTVWSGEAEPIHLLFYHKSAQITNSVTFAIFPSWEPNVDLGSWIEMTDFDGILNPGERITLPFTIRIPENAPMGGHVAGFVGEAVTEPSEEGGFSIIVRVGSRMYLTIGNAAAPITDAQSNAFTSRLTRGQGFAYGDIDEDGLLEALTISGDRSVSLFKNAGKVESPVWQLVSDNYLEVPADVHLGEDISVLDVDGDGMLDVLLTDPYRGTGATVLLFRNIGDPQSPVFSLDSENFLGDCVRGPADTIPYPRAFCLIDVDGDGTKEMIAGAENGVVLFKKLNGENTWTYIPTALDYLGVDFGCSPHAVDIDRDGADEMFTSCKFRKYLFKFPDNDWSPVVDAGSDMVILSSEEDRSTVTGTAFHPLGNSIAYRWLEGNSVLLDWTPVSGNGDCPLALSSVSLSTGTHVLTLEVTNQQKISSDEMSLNIINAETGGLLGHWTFDGCDAKDDSVVRHDGKLLGAMSCDQGRCAASKALGFDGSHWLNQGMLIKDDHFNFKPDAGFSIAAFVKPSGYGAIVVKCPSNNAWDYGLYYSETEKRFVAGFDFNSILWSPQIIEGEWYHVVLNYQDGYWELYLNGELVSSISGYHILSSQGALGIARKGESIQNPDLFLGMIDDVRIYNRMLDSDEIRDLAHACGSLKVYAGPNRFISTEETAVSFLHGAANDATGYPLTYRWLEGDVSLTDWSPVSQDGDCRLDLSTVLLPVGKHTLTLEVTNGNDILSDRMVFTVMQEWLVARYNFDGCDATDSSGQQNNGKLIYHEWNWDSPPNDHIRCMSGRCDGSKSLRVDGHGWIEVFHNEDIDFQPGDSFSLTALVKPESISGQDGPIIVKAPMWTGEWNYGLYYIPGQKRFMSGSSSAILWSPEIIEGNWYYLAVVYQDCSWQFYLNGKLVDSSAGYCITSSKGALGIGRKGEAMSGGGQLFEGDIDDVRMYRRALPAADIQRLARCYGEPVADAGSDLLVTSNNQSETTIYGFGHDEVVHDTLLYRWKEGADILADWRAVELNGDCPLDLSTVSLASGTHTLTLEVSNSQYTTSDEMVLTISLPTYTISAVAGQNGVISTGDAGLGTDLIADLGFYDCTVEDNSENPHNTIAYGELQCVEGRNGYKSFYFPGNAWIKISSRDDLNFTPESSFSIAAFVKPKTNEIIGCNENGSFCTDAGAIVVKSPEDTSWNYGLYYNRSSHSFIAGYHGNSTVVSNPIEEDIWYHLTVVYENCSWKLYLNAELVDTKPENCIIGPSQGAVGIGRKGESTAYSDFFQGAIDDVRIYQRALSESEIRQLTSLITAYPNEPISFRVNQGASRSFTIIPEPGYQIEDVLIDGTSVGAVTSYSLQNVTSDHTVAASFGLIDSTPPEIAISNPSATYAKAGSSITYTITYDGANSVTLSDGDVTLNRTGTANGTAVVSGTGTSTRAITISNITGDGTFGISLAPGTASDSAGNQAPAAGPSPTFTVDNTPPTISISAPSAVCAKAGSNVTYSVSYIDASIVTLADGDVTLNRTGTAGGTAAVSGIGASNRIITISSISGDGMVEISLAAGTACDDAGNCAPGAGPSISFTVDNTGPEAPVIAMPASGTRTNNTKPTFTGTAEAGSTVKLYDASTLLGSVTATGGSWSISPVSAVSGGAHVITAKAIDAAGNTSPRSKAVRLIVDTTAPNAPVIATPANGTYTSNTKPTFTGTAEAGSTVKLYDTAILIGSAIATGGRWSITPESDLAKGSHAVTAKATDAADNTSLRSKVVRLTVDPAGPTPPVIASPSSGTSTNNIRPTFSGTTEAGCTVNLYDSANLIGRAFTKGGRWCITPASALAEGFHTITARATDAAGNISPKSTAVALTVDTTPPTLSISAPSANVTTTGPISYTVTYSGESSISLTAGKVTLLKTGSANGSVAVSGAAEHVRTVTISSISGSGTLKIRLAAGTAVDAAGNRAALAGPSQGFRVTSAGGSQSSAGPDQSVVELGPVRLSGANSTGVSRDIAAYRWSQIDGPSVTLSDPSAVEATFEAPGSSVDGKSLGFQLTVTGPDGSESKDTCIVNVTQDNAPPTAVAGPSQTVVSADIVLLDGLGSSDPDDGILSYDWEQISGVPVVLSDSSMAQPIFVAPDAGTTGESLVFKLTVTDLAGLRSRDTCVVNVRSVNEPPVARAGANQTVRQGARVTLDGSASLDRDNGIASHRWRQLRGIPVALSDPLAARPSFVAPYIEASTDDLVFQLTVTDAWGLQDKGKVTITVTKDVSE